jgi:hypothetical protein
MAEEVRFVLGEIHPTACAADVWDEYDSQAVYHFPNILLSNLRFDGHAELHKWRDNLFNNPKPARRTGMIIPEIL